MKSLILLRGLPGSGKTTLGNFLQSIFPEDEFSTHESDLNFIDVDNFFMNPISEKIDFRPEMLKDAYEWCINECKISMAKNKKGILVAYYFIQDREMDVFYNLAQQFGYTVFSLVVESKHQGSSDKGFSEAAVKNMRKKFDLNL